MPPPRPSEDELLRAVIFDSHFDPYKGIVAHVRILSGTLKAQERLFFMAGDLKTEAIEVGVFKPELVPRRRAGSGGDRLRRDGTQRSGKSEGRRYDNPLGGQREANHAVSRLSRAPADGFRQLFSRRRR